MDLPRGIAIIRCQRGARCVVFVADRLNHDQELCARVYAAVLAATGERYVLITTTELFAAMHAAAA